MFDGSHGYLIVLQTWGWSELYIQTAYDRIVVSPDRNTVLHRTHLSRMRSIKGFEMYDGSHGYLIVFQTWG
jgi:hypothetical protein